MYDKFIPLIYFQKHFERLKEHDLQITFLDWNTNLQVGEFANILRAIEDKGPEAATPPPQLAQEILDADILVVGFSPVPERIINNAKRLRLIGCTRTAYKNIDVKAASAKEITVINAPGRTANAVADLTIGLLIAESRNIARGHAALKLGIWTKSFPNADFQVNLPGKVLGIIGFGNIGRKVHQRAKGFEMKTLIYDPFISKEEITKTGGEPTDLKALLQESDFVTIHVPLNEKTKRLIGENEIKLMKPTAYLINTSRGEIIDEQALIRALEERRIMGAALDVFEKEPLPADHPLLKLDNITLTPHIGGFTTDSRGEGVRIIVDEVERFLKGETLRLTVNP